MEKYNKFIVILIVVVVLAMSIGYSVLNSELSISGEVNYRPQDDVRITSFVDKDKPEEMTIEYSDFSKHQVKLGYTTTEACSITYTVKVENYSGVSMGLVSVEGLNDNVKIQEDIVGKMIVDSAKEETFTITFTSTQQETKTYLLTFKFAQIYTVTYNDLGNTDDYAKGVLSGGKLEQNLGTDAEICSVTMGKSTTDNYTFVDGTIVIENVTGDVVIDGYIPVVEEPTTPPNAPELNGNMIPVYYEATSDTEGEWKKADIDNKNNSWYDYTNQKWANAVTVVEQGSQSRNYYKNEAEVGTVIPMSDINTMWVWIPRYSYTIKSEDGTNYYGKKTSCIMPTQNLPGEIDVKFITKETAIETGSAQYTGDTAIEWRTNVAFDFGGEKKSGIWVGKFETTGTLANVCTNESCVVSSVTIKPDVTSLRNQKVSSFFYAARSMQNDTTTFGFSANNGDLHMMKNDEWGAVAYLSQSKYGKYGNKDYSGNYKEIYQNKSSEYKTGLSNGTPSQESTKTQYAYNNMKKLGERQGQAGPGASTTGNIYGIYDMSGGAREYVMGVLAYYGDGLPMSGYTGSNSGFTGKVYNTNTNVYNDFTNDPPIDFPNLKYYNLYNVATTKDEMPSKSDLKNSVNACNGRTCYGQALSETSGWYDDHAGFVTLDSPWSLRGGYCSNTTNAGVFYSDRTQGSSVGSFGSRFVFAP